MRRPGLAAALALIGLAAPIAARAQNASTAGALELYPTFQAIGVRLAYLGDANANASAYVEWRAQGSTAWTRGVDLTRITNQRWAGSVLWLEPDVRFDVRVTIVDPDGGAVATGTVRTRRPPSSLVTGVTYWVATNGSDANPGTSSAPLATLQAAADRANPGDAIRVKPGIYYQTLSATRAGTGDALIHLLANASGVVLDGSDPAYLTRGDWRNDGGGVFSLPYAGVTRLVCADSVQRLYHQASLAALQAGANGVAQGFAIEGGRLYVKLEDQSSPNGHTMHVARYDIGMHLLANDWQISGFEIRCFGTTSGIAEPLSAGIAITDAQGCWITGNVIHTIGGKGVYVRNLAADNLVENNLCRDPRIVSWPWSACKSHEEEIQGISNYAGRGNVIRFNTCTGMFDGIDAGDPTTEDRAADMDIDDNTIIHVADDGIEPEEMAGINGRIWHNHIEDSLGGVSIAPDFQGPTYFLYNTVVNYRKRGLKFSNSNTGVLWICQNTITSAAGDFPAMWPTGPYSNVHLRNNILVGHNDYVVDDDANESVSGIDFDGDLVFRTNSGPLVNWHGTDYANLAAWHTATGFETNGRFGDPAFVNAAGGDYTPNAGSPAIDAAIRMPGINDCYAGAGPDIGAAEYCTQALVAAPAPVVASGLALEMPAPNPASDAVTLRFAAIGSGRVTLALFDIAGRRVRTLLDGPMPAGVRAVHWDRRDDHGAPVPSGLYVVSLTTDASTVARKLLVVR